MRILLFVLVGLIGVQPLIAQAPTHQRGEQVMVAMSDDAAGTAATGVVIGVSGDRVRFSRDEGVLVNGESAATVPAYVLGLLPTIAAERTVPDGQYFVASRLVEPLDGLAAREKIHLGLVEAHRVSSPQPRIATSRDSSATSS